ncbi:MAG: type IV pilus biogenesis/stability protein PilW [Gammaproteobacteria bacterium]|nr:type IV pilus biogenesis/stability protein PilW [Gammaproteobacteria bacterium]
MKHFHLLIFLLLASLLQACASTSTDRTGVNLKKASQLNAELGLGYLRQNNLSQAKQKLDKALEQDKTNPLANNTYGLLNSRLDKPDLAEKYFKKSIELSPDNGAFINNLGIFLCGQNRYEEAEKTFFRAATNKFYKTPEYAYDNAGLCALGAAEYSKAEDFFQKALQMRANFAQARLHLAEATYKQLKFYEAAAHLAEYEKLAEPSPASLLWGVYIQQALGNKAGSEQLGLQLLQGFPKSKQAATYLKIRSSMD